jgi:hypothetical protein
MSTKAFQVVNSGLKFPKGKDRLVGMVKPDTHTSYPGDKSAGKSERAWKCFKQAVKVVKPDFLIDIGDAGEWISVSAWEWKRVKRPPRGYVCRELLRDGAAVSNDLRELERILPKDCQKFFIQGNHDQWVDNFVNEQVDENGKSVLDSKYQFQTMMGFKDHGWKFFEHGKWVKFGKLYVSHGTMAKGVNHLRNMVLRMGVNVMYGHVHDMGSHSVGSLGGTHKSFSVGCLAQMDKSFLRGDMTNWEHGFPILDIKRNGNFQVHQVPIYAGECKIYGKVIKP